MTETISLLRQLMTNPQPPAGAERCEMCATAIDAEHSHVVNLRDRALLCTCRPCSLLFDRPGADLAFKAVPNRYLSFPEFAISPGQWDELAIPVGVAFFFAHSGLGRTVAFYPSPTGATESELRLDAWEGIVAANSGLRTLEPDVEATLLRRRGEDVDCYLVPIDACYELVGHLRALWRGFDGGAEVHDRIAAFFDGIADRCRPA
jgi:Family of unknown function (DUF5947)